MRLATLKEGGRDGALVVVARDGVRAASAAPVAATLQEALDQWETAAPALAALAAALEEGRAPSFPLHPGALASPLPRAYEWVDGSAFLSHVRLVRKARGAAIPDNLAHEPLVYQGGSSHLLGPRDPMRLLDPAFGLDFEGEVGVVLGDVPCGVAAADAASLIRLVVLINDVTLRNLVPDELAKGFGFFQSKPASALSPFAVTPDELGGAWRDGRLFLKLRSSLNGLEVGRVNAGEEMHFSFHDLIAHIARTRSFSAGTLLGSGTVSSSDASAGVSCLAELRMRELVATGRASTPFLKRGDRVRIFMPDDAGWDVFGAIEQEVVGA
jgi:fumarylacetoacetate (FAA) hydrolase